MYTKKGYDSSDLILNLDNGHNTSILIVAAMRMLHDHIKINVELSQNEIGILEAGMRAWFKCQGCIATLDTKKFHYSLYGVKQKGLSVIDYRGLIKFGGPFNANPLTSTDGEGLKKSTYYLTFVENNVKYGMSCQRKHSLLKEHNLICFTYYDANPRGRNLPRGEKSYGPFS